MRSIIRLSYTVIRIAKVYAHDTIVELGAYLCTWYGYRFHTYLHTIVCSKLTKVSFKCVEYFDRHNEFAKYYCVVDMQDFFARVLVFLN